MNLTMTAARLSSQPPVPEASVQSQIDALWRRGMAIPHRGEASRFLTHTGGPDRCRRTTESGLGLSRNGIGIHRVVELMVLPMVVPANQP